MATSTKPTSIRLTDAEKRRIGAAARKRGISPAAYIKRAALEGVGQSDDAKLLRLESLAAGLLAAVEDERDYRTASSRWESHRKGGTKLYTPEEAKRELGL
jgi:predicted DNA-binding protein